ncbi:MAG: HlyD family type I secretion periplasmic adaptor subunit [Sulfuricurvum sp.]|uniref:HlyD family type I secretion periplasmic adaptor subunit n=1 Tax=Sulfuricurvum sp. TaxID=2025608 RepID=UPI0026213C9A|nr:HlyD family type I secretion periplasmic adaptor subunit [Sulfuricurvum sp.]MDD2830113.1 HlyD family type I secretion periplasmic adaptor subunit [Sulfuricurvum sp.]MDD4949623.1 HlyD family type I secretion periplasmic adaptor subunit [Sulfuricurvum sp.]
MNTPQTQLVTPEQLPSPQTDDRTYRRLGWIVLGFFVGIFGIWASFAPLSSSIPAPGKVIVASKNQEIQHLEGGIIKNILVSDGDSVKANQPLIELDTTQSRAQLDISLSQYYEEVALEARLIAERDNGSTIVFPSDLLSMENQATKTMIAEGQKREFTARKNQLTEEKNIFLQRIEQLKNQITGLEAVIASKSDLSRSYNDEIAEWEVLYKQQLIDKMKLRDIQRQKLSIDGDISNAKSDIARFRAQIAENNAQILNQHQTFYKDVVAELRDTQTKLGDLRARISALKDTLARTTLRAPLDGIVTNLAVHTIGGVIPQGRPVMEIVPNNEPLIIEGKIVASDAINVYDHLKAEIRFPSFAHIKSLDIVEGEVVFVAPDAVQDEKSQMLFYPVKVKVTENGKKELQKNHLLIQAGMPADVMIIVKSRTFADYLIEPITNIARRAFNEQ